MILLTSTSDKISIVTSGAAAVDVHGSFMDYDGATVTPGRQNSAITSATTTDVINAPGSGVQRNVKLLIARNKGGSPNDITVQHSSTTTVELHKVTLAAGETLQYNDRLGFQVL